MSRENPYAKIMAPTVEQQKDDLVFSHPAFGCISRSNTSGSMTRFGVDVPQHQSVHFYINTATMKRHLGTDWVQREGQVLEFSMSQAHFAQLIADGNGTAVPITMRYVRAHGQTTVFPLIDPIVSKRDQIRNEIRSGVHKALGTTLEVLEELEAAVEAKKGVTVLRPLVSRLKTHLSNIPSNTKFYLDCAYEAVDDAADSAMADLKAKLEVHLKNMGLQSTLTQLESDVSVKLLEQNNGDT